MEMIDQVWNRTLSGKADSPTSLALASAALNSRMDFCHRASGACPERTSTGTLTRVRYFGAR